jgi:NAD-dependent dihydropyrimidine dehydrogenase PreA subunit
MEDRFSPESFAESLAAGAVVQPGMGSNTVQQMDDAVSPRWCPVVDYSRCVGCRQCVDFCLFGVYELGPGDRVMVANPDNCKPGCPACSRICPARAIMFPHYEAYPAIAGSDEGVVTPEQRAEGDQGEAANGFAAAETERVACSRQEGLGESSTMPESKSRRCTPQTGEARDELDRLIDRLDRLDSA